VSRFLLQMHGESGAGKSTLALAVGEATGAVVLDKDRIKGPLVEGGLEDTLAGGLTYDVTWLLVQSMLRQGFSVVLDSPAFWPAIVERGRSLAEDAGAAYYVVECRLDDAEEQERRLSSRKRFASQPASRATLAMALGRPGVVRELDVPHLTIDSTQPLDACVGQVLQYIGHDAS
jgi:predicted kinase